MSEEAIEDGAVSTESVMKFRLPLSVFTLLSAFLATAATVPEYVNTGSVLSPPASAPQIDAVTFINEGTFEINDFSPSPLPYSTANTLHFRNSLSGLMLGHPGYWFEHVDGNTRGRMSTWENRGSISSFGSLSNFFTTGANWLLVDSDSIINSGSLNATDQGLIRLSGGTVNMARGRVRAGSPFQSLFFSGSFYLYQTNYFNDVGITDVYWGGGTNNTLGGGGTDMILNGFAPDFAIGNIRSAVHGVAQRSQFGGALFTNNIILPPFPKGVISSTYVTNFGTDMFVQMVFVATNFFDANLTPEISFVPDFFGGPAIAQVGFHSVDRDIVLDRDITNSVYVIDGLAARTNVTLARNIQLNANTRRPDTLVVSKGPYSSFAVPGNSSFTNFSPYRTSYATNVVPVIYAAYSAQLAAQNFTGSDPTNFPGRVEIAGQNVNLRESRIRAESTVSITAANLVTNHLARVSAPFLNFDLGTTQPQLLVSNLAPATVNRLFGNVSAWSAKWDNTDANLPGVNIHFHVLIVDHNLQTTVPVTVNKFLGRGPRIVLHDFLSVNQRLRLDAPSVHVKSNAGLAFPPGWNWGSSNMQNIVNFTNEGFVSVPGTAVLGTDRGTPYTNLINRGTLSAQSYSILGDYFESSGSIVGHASHFRYDGRKICLLGRPFAQELVITTNFFIGPGGIVTNLFTNVVFTGAANITARGNVTINANSVTLSNAILQAGASVPGAVVITPTVRLTDGGPGTTNYWLTTGGIRVLQRPTLSDLMATYATVASPQGSVVQSTWAANDLGAVSLGYSNNLALGKLTLDGGGDGSIIRLSGLPGKKNALYVDYLEVLNNATNFNNIDPGELGLVVDPSLVLYFAHANVDASKLDGKQDNRIRWVKGFMGPLSTTNIVYPSGNVYPVNISLARHKDFDSDGDGTPNIKDPTPVYAQENIDLRISHDVQPNRVLLSWQALRDSTSHIEFKPVIVSDGPWQLLRSTNAPATMRLNMTDNTAGRTQRIYRVRVDLPPQ